MSCIYERDAILEDEYPYLVCTPDCFGCGKITGITERIYTSDFGLRDRRGRYCNLGQFYPITDCCGGILCFQCTFSDEISCIFCGKKTHVSFQKKDGSSKWFNYLDRFSNVLQILGNHQAPKFFRWHKEQYGEESHIWTDLFPNSVFLTNAIKSFTLVACSKIALCKTICLGWTFCQSQAIPIFAKQSKFAAEFLGACYRAEYPVGFQKKEVDSECHFGFLQVLVARMSCSEYEPRNRCIFLAIINSLAAKRFLLW
jgi:hypothetical protein